MRSLIVPLLVWIGLLFLAGCTSAPPLPPPGQYSDNPEPTPELQVRRLPASSERAQAPRNRPPRLQADPDPGADAWTPPRGDWDANPFGGQVAAPAPHESAPAAGTASNYTISDYPARGRPDYSQSSAYAGDGAASPPAIPGSEPVSASGYDNTPYRGSASSLPPVASQSGGATGLVLGEGDVIQFSLFGQDDMDTTAYVSAEGRVSLPLIGGVNIGGLSPVAAEQRIEAAYREGGYFKSPDVNINLDEYRSAQVSVLGEVNKPGRYPLDTKTTVLDALALAEGVKQSGAREVAIIRKGAGGEQHYRIDLQQLVRQGGAAQKMVLTAGDVVFVPEAEKFYIYGEVRRPDAYPLRPGLTVMQAISLGGGVNDKGSNSRIEIRRTGEQGGVRNFKPELTDRVRPDDVIYVKERFF